MLCVQVRIDNDNPSHTVLIIDSANRPGTLVEVSQDALAVSVWMCGMRHVVHVGGTAWRSA
jgi:hypothetical protein